MELDINIIREGVLLVSFALLLWRRSLRKPARVKPLDAGEQASLQRLLTGLADSPVTEKSPSDSGPRS